MVLSNLWRLGLGLGLMVLWVMHLLQLLGQRLGGWRLWLLHWWLLDGRLGLQSLLLLLLLQMQLCDPLQLLLLLLYLGAEQAALSHPTGSGPSASLARRKPAQAALIWVEGALPTEGHREHTESVPAPWPPNTGPP